MQLISVTSERLQAAIRRLLPSQAGFSEDLEAVNTIQPIIDLTPVAEGTEIPIELQNALAFSSTQFLVSAGAQSLGTNPGFYRVVGSATMKPDTASDQAIKLEIFDGSTYKQIFGYSVRANSNTSMAVDSFDLLCFVAVGEQILISTDNVSTVAFGTARQVADVNGQLIDPVGFNPQ